MVFIYDVGEFYVKLEIVYGNSAAIDSVALYRLKHFAFTCLQRQSIKVVNF